MEIHHFEQGWVTPVLSYALSVLGSALGLVCAIRLRTAPGSGARAWWLSLSAVAIGGTGIWAMHFVAMMGFRVVGTPIRYDVGLTAASALLAVVAVGAGLAVAFGGATVRAARLVTGGVLAGLGVAAMHYLGMAGMHLNAHISYGVPRVAASIAVAVVAATVALWLAARVHRPVAVLGAALIMGVAVNGMHFTGMSAMSARPGADTGVPGGATASSLLVPIGVAVVFALLALGYALMAAPTEEDRAAAAYLAARREESAARRAAATPNAAPMAAGLLDSPRRATGRRAARPGATGPRQPTIPQQGGHVAKARDSALGSGTWTYRDRSDRQ
ncbi:MHYT domain-containing protein [Symbioplanes lichenis]|uniref:MHYT domain-containing protein n=1 Tax=Symbioplanes lichenis TaxID=1629072 RepID=UPI002738A842|nr:MHYT domain-containing protein [Actinoplanes lichenis]